MPACRHPNPGVSPEFHNERTRQLVATAVARGAHRREPLATTVARGEHRGARRAPKHPLDFGPKPV